MTDPQLDHGRLADLQGELRYLLNRWDPIGVYDEETDVPPDEYDCLIGPILTRLARGDSRAAFSEYLWNEIENHFGLDPVRCGNRRVRGPPSGVVCSEEPCLLTPPSIRICRCGTFGQWSHSDSRPPFA